MGARPKIENEFDNFELIIAAGQLPANQPGQLYNCTPAIRPWEKIGHVVSAMTLRAPAAEGGPALKRETERI
jgi:hypothetical protein